MRIIILFLFVYNILSAQVSNYSGLKLQLTPGISIMTDSATKIKAANDGSKYLNNATQSTPSVMPTDNSTFWTFVDDEIHSPNTGSLKITDKLTMYSRISTSTVPNVGCIGIQSWNGNANNSNGLTGWGTAVVSNKARSFVNFSKGVQTVTSTTSINDGVNRKIATTVSCSRKWSNYGKLIAGGSQPAVLKIGSIYYMYRDSLDDTYVDSSTSPYFSNGMRARKVITGASWAGALYKDGTYYITATNTNLDTIFLWTSSSPTTGFTKVATVAVKNSGSLFMMGDPEMIYVQDSFKVYYSAFATATTGTIFMASSKTGANGTWGVRGTVIPNGGAGTFDQGLCADANPVKLEDGSYILFYTGHHSSLNKQQQGYATSSDGITWTKFSGNPIHYFSGQNYEAGIYGPNEPSFLYEAGAGPGGLGIWRCYIRSQNETPPFAIGYSEFFADPSSANHLPICGNETITLNMYVDNSLEATTTVTGATGLDYMPAPSIATYVGGNNVNMFRYSGNLYDIRIYDKIKITF